MLATQVELIQTFVGAATKGASLCQQMLMGSGKTTVVTPLVALMLAQNNRLLTVVVPSSLLSFAQVRTREAAQDTEQLAF